MKILVQRVINAHVKIDGNIKGSIEKGLVLFVGFGTNDLESDIDKLIAKVINLRIFDDEDGIMNKSILDVSGSILSISQFTLYADTNSGRRPSYTHAMHPDKATILYDLFNHKLKKHVKLETGVFGANMQVNLINDGPITIMLESGNKSV